MQSIADRIRDDRPRLFLDADRWPAIEAVARTREADHFRRVRAGVDDLLETDLERADYGTKAANAAFVARVTGDDRYRDLARDLLARSVDHYHACYEADEAVDWYAHSRINALSAYDWLFDDLPGDERERLGTSLLDAVEQTQPTEDRSSFPGENWGGAEGGFYGTRSLKWYAGVATVGEGIDDERANRFLEAGYEDYRDLLEYRAAAAGDVGGAASATLAYAFGHYPWAEFNFFHTVASATGESIAEDWQYPALLPAYYFWNRLPAGDETDGREFGIGDAYHELNGLRHDYRMHLHLTQLLHFYGEERPRAARFAKWLRERVPREFHPERSSYPLARFLAFENRPELEPEGPPLDLDSARHFGGMGQTFFRSGSGPDDTYAMFVADGDIISHKHYDNNSFAIFKKGFLALDAGARTFPSNHLSHYYCRTVAHNAVLIHMPGEELPGRYWGSPTPADEEEDRPIPNDGGQCERLGSEVVAFETRPDYSYVAGDATAAYHEEKCDLALRQFVFLPPDHFVVFDRVRTTEPQYETTWLLQTATEPRIDGNVATAAHEEGRLFSRTLLPGDAAVTAVGGPGEQFLSDGRNWSLPDHHEFPEENPLYGQWRVEVSPEPDAREDRFLHVLRADDRSATEMADAELLEQDGEEGVAFEANGTRWEVLFATDGGAAGSIRGVDPDGNTTVDRELTESVQSQSGLFE